jgi:hypothetical protein
VEDKEYLKYLVNQAIKESFSDFVKKSEDDISNLFSDLYEEVESDFSKFKNVEQANLRASFDDVQSGLKSSFNDGLDLLEEKIAENIKILILQHKDEIDKSHNSHKEELGDSHKEHKKEMQWFTAGVVAIFLAGFIGVIATFLPWAVNAYVDKQVVDKFKLEEERIDSILDKKLSSRSICKLSARPSHSNNK